MHNETCPFENRSDWEVIVCCSINTWSQLFFPVNTPDSYINFGCPFYQSSDHAIFTGGLMNHEQPQPKQ